MGRGAVSRIKTRQRVSVARNGQKIKCENNFVDEVCLGAPQFFVNATKVPEDFGIYIQLCAVMDAGTFLPTVKQNRRPKDGSIYRGVTTRQSKAGVKKWIAQQRIPKTATAHARTQHIGIFDSEPEAGSAWTAWVHKTGNLHLLDEEAAAGAPAADSKENEEPFHVENRHMQREVYGKKSNQQQTQTSAVENRPPENVLCIRLRSINTSVMNFFCVAWIQRVYDCNRICAGVRAGESVCEGKDNEQAPAGEERGEQEQGEQGEEEHENGE